MEQYIITITRQFGSLGRPIAKEMADILGIEYYDRDIVEETSKKLGLPVSTVSEEEESAKSHLFNMSYPLGMGTSLMQDNIFKTQADIIQKLAEKQSCIIVGRCSDYILRNRKNSIHIFIYAPYHERLRNCVDILHMEPEEAKRMIQQVDKAREAYHKTYAHFLPQDFTQKHIMIDSSLLGINGTARILSQLVKEKFGDDLPR